MKIQLLNIGLSIAIICILFVDFFGANEFNIERGYTDVFSFLLILNICRLALQNRIQLRVIGLFINLILLGILVYSLLALAILSFGIGFMGISFPAILGLSIIVNFVFISVLMNESIRLIKSKNKPDKNVG
jgi:hypothetical protein